MPKLVPTTTSPSRARPGAGHNVALLVAAALALGQPAPAAAAFASGASLYANCSSEAVNLLVADCYGYITGISDALEGGPVHGARACVPRNVTIEDVGNAAIAWIRAHPERQHERAAAVVAAALMDAFPCGGGAV